MSSEKLIQAGDFRFVECILKSSSGVVAEKFEKQIVSLEITEDIFKNSMQGIVVVIDNNNLPINMPLTGQDFLTLKIITPGVESQPVVDTVFCITQLVGRHEDLSVGAMTYTFKLISSETLRDNRVRVQSSYTDTPSKVVEHIMKNFIKSTKNMTIEETTGTRKYVSPYSRPFDFIKNLTRESVSSKTNSPNYLFYENTKGYFFVTTDYLYNQNIVAEFEPSDTGLLEPHGKRDLDRDMRNILSLGVSNTTNTVAAARGGMFGGRLIVYNLFNKNYELFDHDYFRDFDKHSRMNENHIYNESPIDEEGNTLGNFPKSNINLHPTSKSDGLDARYSDNLSDNQIERWLLQHRAKLMELRLGQSMILTVHGRANIAVGDKVHVTKPITGKTHGDSDLDKINDGEFLVTHIKHTFESAPDTHIMDMNVTNDSIAHSYDIKGDTKEPKKLGTTQIV